MWKNINVTIVIDQNQYLILRLCIDDSVKGNVLGSQSKLGLELGHTSHEL